MALDFRRLEKGAAQANVPLVEGDILFVPSRDPNRRSWDDISGRRSPAQPLPVDGPCVTLHEHTGPGVPIGGPGLFVVWAGRGGSPSGYSVAMEASP